MANRELDLGTVWSGVHCHALVRTRVPWRTWWRPWLGFWRRSRREQDRRQKGRREPAGRHERRPRTTSSLGELPVRGVCRDGVRADLQLLQAALGHRTMTNISHAFHITLRVLRRIPRATMPFEHIQAGRADPAGLVDDHDLLTKPAPPLHYDIVMLVSSDRHKRFAKLSYINAIHASVVY